VLLLTDKLQFFITLGEIFSFPAPCVIFRIFRGLLFLKIDETFKKTFIAKYKIAVRDLTIFIHMRALTRGEITRNMYVTRLDPVNRNQKMRMIGHQYIGMNLAADLACPFTHRPKKINNLHRKETRLGICCRVA